MILNSKELQVRYSNYSNPNNKIGRDIKSGLLFKVNRALYEDDKNTEGYLLACIIEMPSYLSFEYALSKYGLISERVSVYTSATCLKKHNKQICNYFGVYTYTDVPKDAWRFGIKILEENGRTYLIATKEKALCDYLYKQKPLSSIKKLKNLLFDDLRIDKSMFEDFLFNDLLELCAIYRKKNLKLLEKLIRKEYLNG